MISFTDKALNRNKESEEKCQVLDPTISSSLDPGEYDLTWDPLDLLIFPEEVPGQATWRLDLQDH